MFDELKNRFFVMVGPNVIENYEHTLMIATQLKEIMEELDILFIFKVSFDKANRTSLSSYRGPGLEEGIQILQRIKTELNIPIITDIHESCQASIVAEVADIIQIPAFLCRQTDLLKAAAETGKIIHIKKGQFCSADVVHKSAEKIRAFGNNQILLCERGTMFGYQDLIVDPRNIIKLKKFDNIVTMDITHCLQQPAQVQADGSIRSGGLRDMIPYMGRVAVTLGVNGIFMEVHENPDQALCDAPTQFPLDKLKDYLKELKELNEFVKNQSRCN
jgi:2-dehydro-3-deoxyphosphooctonate aldolase (KDO 8-P synthase)